MSEKPYSEMDDLEKALWLLEYLARDGGDYIGQETCQLLVEHIASQGKTINDMALELKVAHDENTRLRGEIARMREPITVRNTGAYGNPPESDIDAIGEWADFSAQQLADTLNALESETHTGDSATTEIVKLSYESQQKGETD